VARTGAKKNGIIKEENQFVSFRLSQCHRNSTDKKEKGKSIGRNKRGNIPNEMKMETKYTLHPRGDAEYRIRRERR
jgi:hypothetical protein